MRVVAVGGGPTAIEVAGEIKTTWPGAEMTMVSHRCGEFSGARVVLETPLFIALAPYAPRFPFETWIMPKSHLSCYSSSSNADFKDLAGLLQNVLQRIDRALSIPPYNFVIHTSPAHEARRSKLASRGRLR